MSLISVRDDGKPVTMIGGPVLSFRSLMLLCFCGCLSGMIDSPSEAASHSVSVSRYHSPYSASASARYRGYSANRYYTTSYRRNYSIPPRSTYYGYGARRYNYRYRPYAATAGYRYYRPGYYGFSRYPAAGYAYYGYNTYYPRQFYGAWSAYSSCYCSPYSGFRSAYFPGYGSYAPLWGSYTPYWGSYAPNWGAYYGSPWSYYPGYFGNYYGLGCGLWPYQPTLYGSIVFQSGYNMGYYGSSYYRFW